MVCQVCVIGGGIIGMSSALRILESFKDVKVTVIAEEFSPNTTSDVAAGFWMPFKTGNTPIHLINRWSKETFDYLLNLFNSSDAIHSGVNTVSGYKLFINQRQDMFWKDTVLNIRDMNAKELQLFPEAKDGVFLTTIITTVSIYLPWITSKIVSMGGTLKQKKISSLSELTPKYDVIINCCGLGNYDLLKDEKMSPIRGQLLRVNAPWIKHFVTLDKPEAPVCIIPTFHNVVLGVTKQFGSWNKELCEEDRKRIIENCTKLVPSLKDPDVIKEYVGLRPFRENTRLDKEILNENSKRVVLINNYGHGLCGVSTFWGCAKDVVQLLGEEFSLPKQIEAKF